MERTCPALCSGGPGFLSLGLEKAFLTEAFVISLSPCRKIAGGENIKESVLLLSLKRNMQIAWYYSI